MLKDWKKGNGYVYNNYKNWPYKQLTMELDNTMVQIKKVNSSGSWSSYLTKRFKTKPQALKFAKDYMRRH